MTACISSPEVSLVEETRDAPVSPDGSAEDIALVADGGEGGGEADAPTTDGGAPPHPEEDAGSAPPPREDEGEDDDADDDDDDGPGNGKGKGKPPKKKE